MRRLALALLAATSCGRATPVESAYVEQAHRLQLHADEAIRAGSPDQARDDLAQAAQLAAPSGMPANEVLAIRADAYARLAGLELVRGRTAEALRAAQQGLDLGAPPDIFRAALLVARGKAYEATGHDAEAVADYHQAMRIDETLLAEDATARDSTTGEKP